MSGELILNVTNRHTAEYKKVPVHGGPELLFVSYFEGSSGDQWVCLEGPGTLYLMGGDVDWREVSVVANAEAPGWQVPGLVLSVPEAQWLDACWRSWQGRKERK